MQKTFYSNGKLLLTGEYVVLDGAMSLAVPTKFGQTLIIEESNDFMIHWKSFDYDQSIWFENNIPFSSIIAKKKYDEAENIKNTLIEILHEAYLLNSDFITKSSGYTVTTALSFPKFWGLGTSSTLINNIAQWVCVDAYTLLKNSFGGSGYDIACAQNNSPILYQLKEEKPIIKKVIFNPDFNEYLHFVYLNRKQSSKEAIKSYHNNQGNIEKSISKIDKITHEVLNAKEVQQFAQALENHEIIMSEILETQTVKEALFPDFKGIIKSLGAWGGDFVLVISRNNPTDYFNASGYKTIINYKDMVL